MASMKELRFSHSEGHTEACFDKTGKYILTAGADGDVRVYNGLLDDDAVSFRVGTQVTAVAIGNGEVAVATDCNDVKTFSIPEGLQQDILVIFTAHVNTICFSGDGSHLAAGSSDFNIKVITKEDRSQKVLSGHEAPVLSVVFSPDGKYLASSSCDGTLKIWNIERQEIIKSLNIFPKCNDTSTSKTLCKITWCHGKSQVIAAPVGKGIMLISTENWSELCTLSHFHSELVSIVACSPCWNYIASSSVNGEIAIWDIATKKQIESLKHEHGSKITSLDWNPCESGELVYADDQGQFSLCSNVLSSTSKSDQYNATDLFAGSDDEDLTNHKQRKRAHVDDDDDDDDAPIGSAHKKHRVQNFENFLDDEADDDDNDDDADISLNLIKEGLVPKALDAMDEDEDEDSLQGFIVEEKPKRPILPRLSLQKAFQPGSTPCHLMHRFMTWNSIGIIRCHSEDEVSTIDIEFHDAGLHHPLHFNNVMNHTIAALSSTAAVLACVSQEDIPSKLVCLHFGTWDSTKDWTTSMPKGEDIKSVAVNQRYIAVATDGNLVRVFTVGGLQYHLFSIPGPVVTMAMSETQLIIVYHQGTGLPDCQCLGVKLFEIGKKHWKMSTEHQLPLSKKATLIWIGFSAEETPVAVDSRGIVRTLQRTFGNTWIPVLNLKNQTKTKSDNYWVIGLTENPPEIRCILCKGANFPATLPRPVPSALSFEIPVCDKDTEKGQMEENFMRNKVTMGFYEYQKRKGIVAEADLVAEAKKTEIQMLIKLFALSCKSDRIFRAVEICELMPNAETVSLAIQYATKMRKMNLAQRLGELARRKAREEEDNLDDQISNSESEDDDSKDNYRPPVASKGASSYTRQKIRLPLKGRKSLPKITAKKDLRKAPSDISADDSDHEIEEALRNEDEELQDYCEDDQMISDDEVNDVASKETAESRISLASSQGRGNPFKVAKKPIQNSNSSKGTSYFEQLESKMPPKNKTVAGKSEQQTKITQKNTSRSTSKQATLFQKKSTATASKKEKEESKEEPKSQTKKVTGFMLFREQLSNGQNETGNEEFVKKSLEEWKNLAPSEKKSWNLKAKGEIDIETQKSNGCGNIHEKENGKSIIDSSSEKRHSRNLDDIKGKTSQTTVESKSKLAAFAFSKKE